MNLPFISFLIVQINDPKKKKFKSPNLSTLLEFMIILNLKLIDNSFGSILGRYVMGGIIDTYNQLIVSLSLFNKFLITPILYSSF